MESKGEKGQRRSRRAQNDQQRCARATGAVEVKGGGDGGLAASAMLLSGGSGIALVGQDCRIEMRDKMERPDLGLVYTGTPTSLIRAQRARTLQWPAKRQRIS